VDRLRQLLRPARLGDVGDERGEPGPFVVVEIGLAELRARRSRLLDELRSGQVLQRGADDPGVREEPGQGQPLQPGQQLAAGEIARRAEEHDDVRSGHSIDDGHEVVPP
jgi:hypothetical protein